MLIEAFDTVVFAEGQLTRLRAAQKLIARKQTLADEKQWLQTAVDRLAAAVEPLAGLASKCAQLPELEAVRGDLAKSLQNGAIDAVERLQAGITFHAGPRSPVLEELFGHYKFPPLRRAAKEEFEKFTTSFTKRLRTQYIKRILAGDDYAPVQAAVAQVTAAFDGWRAAFAPEALPEADADKLRAQLQVASDTVTPVLHQSRLLAEAALVTVDGAFEEAGLAAKPKKRSAPAKTAAAEEAPAAVEEDAPAEAEVPAAEVVEAAPAPAPAPAAKGKRKRAAEA